MKKLLLFLILVLNHADSLASVYATQVSSVKRPSLRDSKEVRDAMQHHKKQPFDIIKALKTNDKLTVDALKTLKTKGYDINYLDRDSETGETALMIATKKNRLDILMYVIDKVFPKILSPDLNKEKFYLNDQDLEGNTALHHSMSLVASLAPHNAQAARSRNSIENGKYLNSIALAKYLIPKFAESRKGTGQRNKSNITALNIAIQIPDQKVMHDLVSKLLSTMKPGDLVARDRETLETPLHFAVRKGDFELVQLLLKAGADREIQLGTNQTPLMLARAIKKRLINEDADKSVIEKYNAIIKALED